MSYVLLVDDEHRFLDASAETLRRAGHQVTTADCISGARSAIERSKPEFAFIDLMLPDGNGLELISLLSGDPPCRITLVTGNEGIAARVRSLSGPGIQYMTKPLRELELLSVVADRPASTDSSQTAKVPLHFGLLVGESPGMRKVYETIELFARSDAAVLINGETGCGKELVAKALHQESECTGPLVTVNCGALSKELIASEFFGHEKGSFTGAARKHEGVFERANGGSLFLDEITEMPLSLQASLLRAVESGHVTRVGGEREHPFDVRIIAATNRNAGEAVENNALRQDLYFRLAEFAITVPPLRERREDIPLLMAYFLRRLNERYDTQKTVSDGCQSQFLSYEWPGNVRELKHVLHRAFVLSRDDNAAIAAPGEFSDGNIEIHRRNVEAGRSIRSVEKELILKTLDHFGGDKQQAAETLGISVRTLYNRLSQYEDGTP